jgi:hypothetical protein
MQEEGEELNDDSRFGSDGRVCDTRGIYRGNGMLISHSAPAN